MQKTDSTTRTLLGLIQKKIPSNQLLQNEQYSNQLIKIAEHCLPILSDCHTCPRCMLRYLGIRDKTFHQTLPKLMMASKDTNLPASDSNEGSLVPQKRSSEEVSDQENNDPLVSDQCIATCRVCLGILNLDFEKMAKDAYKKTQDYELVEKKFLTTIRFPPVTAIRHRSICLMLEESIKETPGLDWTLPSPVELKEVFKNLVSDAFIKESGFTFEARHPFLFNIHLEHPETRKDYAFLTKIPEAHVKVRVVRRRGQEIIEGASLEKLIKAVPKVNYEQFKEASQIPPPPISKAVEVADVSFFHESIFVAGRYNKLQRGISNTPWEIHGKRLAEHSVQELIAEHIDKVFMNESHKFSSAGREDADVLMLGQGRPFYLELINPKRLTVTQEDMNRLMQIINEKSQGKIEVRDLQLVSRDSTKIMKDSVSTKSKSYTCLVKLSKPVSLDKVQSLSGQEKIALKQRNPIRVPRRADLVRDKLVERIVIRPEDPAAENETELLRVELKTSAGTYVKEFVHGDQGRTEPSLKSLFDVDEAQCLELDVLEVHLDWPSSLSSN